MNIIMNQRYEPLALFSKNIIPCLLFICIRVFLCFYLQKSMFPYGPRIERVFFLLSCHHAPTWPSLSQFPNIEWVLINVCWKNMWMRWGRGKAGRLRNAEMRIQKSLLIPRLHYIHDSKTKNTFYWKTTLLITRQFHRHYLGVGGSSGKMI